MPPELAHVALALAPQGLGMGGGVWDPQAVREWDEQLALDVLMVIGTKAERGESKGEY